MTTGSEGVNVMVPADWVPTHLFDAWDRAYRDYVAASDRMDTRSLHNREVLGGLSARVSVTWRDMAGASGVPWWLVAAFTAAAEAFDLQARAWAGAERDARYAARERHPSGRPDDSGGGQGSVSWLPRDGGGGVGA